MDLSNRQYVCFQAHSHVGSHVLKMKLNQILSFETAAYTGPSEDLISTRHVNLFVVLEAYGGTRNSSYHRRGTRHVVLLRWMEYGSTTMMVSSFREISP